MKVFRFPAATTSEAYTHFVRTVKSGLPKKLIMRSMSDAEAEAFAKVAPEDRYGVWALNLTDAGRNVRVWKAIEPGDIAAFYAHKRFEYFAPILFTWKSDSLQEIAGWKPPESGRYSLALAIGQLERAISETQNIVHLSNMSAYQFTPIFMTQRQVEN